MYETGVTTPRWRMLLYPNALLRFVLHARADRVLQCMFHSPERTYLGVTQYDTSSRSAGLQTRDASEPWKLALDEI